MTAPPVPLVLPPLEAVPPDADPLPLAAPPVDEAVLPVGLPDPELQAPVTQETFVGEEHAQRLASSKNRKARWDLQPMSAVLLGRQVKSLHLGPLLRMCRKS